MSSPSCSVRSRAIPVSSPRATDLGHTRPLIYNPRTGESAELQLDALDGDVIPLDWSADGGTLLLCQRARAQERLYRYELASHRLHALAYPSGSVTGHLCDT